MCRSQVFELAFAGALRGPRTLACFDWTTLARRRDPRVLAWPQEAHGGDRSGSGPCAPKATSGWLGVETPEWDDIDREMRSHKGVEYVRGLWSLRTI